MQHTQNIATRKAPSRKPTVIVKEQVRKNLRATDWMTNCIESSVDTPIHLGFQQTQPGPQSSSPAPRSPSCSRTSSCPTWKMSTTAPPWSWSWVRRWGLWWRRCPARYRLVCTVSPERAGGAGRRWGSALCRWPVAVCGITTWTPVSHSYKNRELFCVVSVFAVYCEWKQRMK